MHRHMLHTVLTDICTGILWIAMQSGCRRPCWRHQTRQWQHSFSQNRWLCERPEVGQTATWNRAVDPRQRAASFAHPVTPQQCVWGFFYATGKWNSSQVESDWHLCGPWAGEGRGSTGEGGSGNGIKNFDLVEKTKVLQGWQTQQKHTTAVALVSIEHLDVGGYPDLSLWDASSLPTRITQGHWLRRCVSPTLGWSFSPTAPSHLVPLASLMEKGSDAFPCFYMNGTPPLCQSPYLLLPIRLPFHHTAIAISPWMGRFHPLDTHNQTLKWTSRLPDLWLYLAVPEKVDYSLSLSLCFSVTENRMPQTLGFPFPSPYLPEWMSVHICLQPL